MTTPRRLSLVFLMFAFCALLSAMLYAQALPTRETPSSKPLLQDNAIVWRVHHAVPNFPGSVLRDFVDMYAETVSIVVGLGLGRTTLPVYLRPEEATIYTYPHLEKSPTLIAEPVRVTTNDSTTILFLIGMYQQKPPLNPRYLKYNPPRAPPTPRGSCVTRVGHLVPGVPPVDVLVDGQTVLRQLAYGNFSVPTVVPSGAHNVSIQFGGKSLDLDTKLQCDGSAQSSDTVYVVEPDMEGGVHGVILPAFAR